MLGLCFFFFFVAKGHRIRNVCAAAANGVSGTATHLVACSPHSNPIFIHILLSKHFYFFSRFFKKHSQSIVLLRFCLVLSHVQIFSVSGDAFCSVVLFCFVLFCSLRVGKEEKQKENQKSENRKAKKGFVNQARRDKFIAGFAD